MEKLILIRHSSNDTNSVINDIIRYCNILMVSSLEAVCNFRLCKDQYNLLNKLEEFRNYKITKVEPKNGIILSGEHLDITIGLSHDEMKALLQIVVKNELNVTITFGAIKMVLNDNDGDFIIINTRNSSYNSIKRLSLRP